MAKTTLEQIIQHCLSGQSLAQKELYYLLVDDLLLVAHRYTRDKDHARDVVQNTFVRIFQNLSGYTPALASLATWAKTICINEAIAFLRKNKKYSGQISIEEVIHPFTHELDDNVTIEQLNEKIQMLSIEHRTILNMYYFDELSHKEIAAILQIEETSSRSRLSRAREQLKNNWNAVVTILILKFLIYGSTIG